mgnify:CR=1 FL=1
MNPQPKPIKSHDNKYLNYIRGLKCIFCGKSKEAGFDVHPHHLPNGNQTRRSVDIQNTIPVCFQCHRWLHDHPKDEKDILDQLIAKANKIRKEYF